MAAQKKQQKGLRKFYRETIAELRKVSWPTRSEAIHLTRVVLIVIFDGCVSGHPGLSFHPVVRIDPGCLEATRLLLEVQTMDINENEEQMDEIEPQSSDPQPVPEPEDGTNLKKKHSVDPGIENLKNGIQELKKRTLKLKAS